MSLKAKLVSTISAFVLVLALMVVGVLAAASGTVGLGGSITFTATDIVGSVTVAYQNAANSPAGQSESFDATDATVAFKWETEALEFTSNTNPASSPITVTITIANDATDRPMYVTFTEGSEQAPVVISGTDASRVTASAITYNTDQTVTSGEAIQIPADTDYTFTFKLTAADFNDTIDAAWSCDFELNATNS